jgi:hypothetical protein
MNSLSESQKEITMDFRVEKNVKSAEDVRKHELFGKAVFIECGLHDPANFCYDHHSMNDGGLFMLSSVGQVYEDLVELRRMPSVVVMNHVRHLDNLMVLYLLVYQRTVLNPDTFQLVCVADMIDRVGPLAIGVVPQIPAAVLTTAQNLIPYKEWEADEEELKIAALKAVASIRSMVTMAEEVVEYQTIMDIKPFAVVTAEKPLGRTLYEAGYDAYAAYMDNKDGSRKWTLARASKYVPFDIPAAIAALNELEPGWGGRDTVAGSPQGVGSRLPIETVLEVLKSAYKG